MNGRAKPEYSISDLEGKKNSRRMRRTGELKRRLICEKVDKKVN